MSESKARIQIEKRGLKFWMALTTILVVVFSFASYSYGLSVSTETIGDRVDVEWLRDDSCSIPRVEWVANFTAGAFDLKATVTNDLGVSASFDVDLILDGVAESPLNTGSVASGANVSVIFPVNVADYNGSKASVMCTRV